MGDAALDKWISEYPDPSKIPFKLRPATLYGVVDLYDVYDVGDPGSWARTYDQRSYDWFYDASAKKPRELTLSQAIAARIHDASIEDGIFRFLAADGAKTVGIMGGHDVPRSADTFAKTALMTRELRRKSFKIVSGGGPGLMEAANFGAFLAPYEDAQFDRQLKTLRGKETTDGPPAWIDTACSVRTSLLGDWRKAALPGSSSLGIPTWLYGNEPPNLFSTSIGKYFYNSVREDGLVSIANGGLLFGPGSAGTVQEVFQNATYNYYGASHTPMVFLGRNYWHPARYDATGFDPRSKSKPLYPLIEKLAVDAKSSFLDHLLISDDPDEIVAFLEGFAANPSTSTLADVRLEQRLLIDFDS